MSMIKALLPMGVMFGVKHVMDVDDEENPPYLRGLFACSQSILAIVFIYLYLQIQKKMIKQNLK
eukprot:UN05084